MSKSDRSAIRIYSLRIESTFLDDRERLCREGFVQFDHIDIRELQSGHLESFRNCEDWAESHFFWFVSCGGKRNITRQGLDTQCLRTLRRHDNRRRGAIGHL